jgi:hypothetical protein
LTFADAAGTQSVALSGWGWAVPTDTLSATSLTFPGTIVGQLSAAETVTIANTGDAPLTCIYVWAGGASSPPTTCPQAQPPSTGPFTTSNQCTTQLPGNSTCTISVFFTPTAVGVQTGTLTIYDQLRTQTVALSGTGLAPPVITVSPTSLMFPTQPVGVASQPSTLTVSNTGGAAMANVSFQFTGDAAGSFANPSTTCGTVLNNGSSCTVQVIFTPPASGGMTGTLVVSSSTLGVKPVSVPLNNAAGIPAALQVTPPVLSFPATGVGSTSSPITVTVANPGSVAGLSDLALAATAGFQLANNTCTPTLAPQAGCTVGVTFAPASAGTQSGTLTVTSSTLTTGATAALSGMGVDFTVTVSGSASQTVASGETGSYTLVITPLNGSAGAFTFQCGTLPANALCLFNPTTETLGSGVTGNVTVQISTGQSGSSARVASPLGWRVLPLACGFVLLPLAWRRRRNGLLLAVLLATVAGGASSCSGSGGGSGGNPTNPTKGTNPTPSGTYSIPATVLSSGVQHSVTLTLTVD